MILEEQKKRLTNLLSKSDDNLLQFDEAIDEKVNVSSCGEYMQYYIINPKNGVKRYAKKVENKYVSKILQYNYESEVNKVIIRNLKCLEQFIKNYDPYAVKNAYEKMCEGRKRLVKPIMEPDSEYIKRWFKEHPGSQNTFPVSTNIYTEREENVRSKSEKIIADLLTKHGIPYAYEATIAMADGSLVYPDFLILNVRERKTIAWEHLGLGEIENYARKNLNKIRDYEEIGYELGDRLILSIEMESGDLDYREVEKKIINHCL